MYDSDEEFYSRQILGARPHDKDRLVRARIAEALRFLMFGGKLDGTEPLAERAEPSFSPGVRILDVGCRDGWSLEYLKKGCTYGFRAFGRKKRFRNGRGIELSHETVEYARAKGRNVVQGDIRNCMLGENAFDVIFTRHCLEHLDNPLQALENIRRMLKPEGVLLAIVPKEDRQIHPEKSLHSYRFCSDQELAELVAAAGLIVTGHFRRNEYFYQKRKYWYKLSTRPRRMGPELWVLAAKPEKKRDQE